MRAQEIAEGATLSPAALRNLFAHTVARLDEKDRDRVARAAQTQDHQGWRYLPVVSANYRAATLLIDAQGRAGKFVAIDPWEATSAPSTE